MDVSILIVSFNTREMTLACLESVYRETAGLEYEVLVVDNASRDGSAEAIRDAYPQVELLALDENLGFAQANNLAARSARGEFLLLLNPDTVVLRGAVQKLHAFIRDRPNAGAVGGRTYLGDGNLDPSSCWGRMTPWSTFCRAVGLTAIFPKSRIFDPESLGRWQRDSARPVDIVAGCLLMIRRDLWQELDGFDPAFFMYAEDADLSMRVAERGLTNWFVPEAEIIHYCGATEKVRADKLVRLFRAKSQLFQKHWSPTAARFGAFMLSVHAWTRTAAIPVATLLAGADRAECLEVWSDVFERRSEWRIS